jgi:hypothetical protein
MKSRIIYCRCGQPCGRQYPDYPGEPGFSEGFGEDFVLYEIWHCSQKCLDEAKAVVEKAIQEYRVAMGWNAIGGEDAQ